MGRKLFGGSNKGGRFSTNRNDAAPVSRPRREADSQPTQRDDRNARRPRREKKPRNKLKTANVILSIVLVLEILYCVAIFTNIPFVKRLRTMYIETAMSTMNHHWLAEAFIPHDIVNKVVENTLRAQQEQIGVNSSWGDTEATKPTEPATKPTEEVTVPTEPEETTEPTVSEEERFYELFWEIDRERMELYLAAHPEALDNGWEHIKINEAGLDDEGTSIITIHGDQVLAIDAENQIALIRVKGSTYRGVLAIAKNSEKLHLYPSEGIGSYGQVAGDIAQANNGVLAVTASGFVDPDGGGNGGQIAGYCMADGKEYGWHYGWGYKRLELHEDNRFYIIDAPYGVSEGTTDAAEFMPGLIVDGKVIVDESSDWTAMNPRCCVGQSRKEEFMFLVIEGRRIDSAGTDVIECAGILAKYDCYQAMNMDGGTSAIMWYDGEYVTRCSNANLPSGRSLPNAWVYVK